MLTFPDHALGLRKQLRGDLLRGSAHIPRKRRRTCTIELAAKADGRDRMRDRTPAIQNRHRYDRDAVDVVAAIDAETLPACQIYFLAPGAIARRIVPAQQAKSLLDLLPGLPAERGDAPPGGADQCGKPAANIYMRRTGAWPGLFAEPSTDVNTLGSRTYRQLESLSLRQQNYISI